MPEQQAKEPNHENSSDEDNDRLSSNNGHRRLIMANTEFREHNDSDLQSVLMELHGEVVLLRDQVNAMREMTVHLDTTFQQFHRSVEQHIIQRANQLSDDLIATNETEQQTDQVTATTQTDQPEAVDPDVSAASAAEGEKK